MVLAYERASRKKPRLVACYRHGHIGLGPKLGFGARTEQVVARHLSFLSAAF
jgi:hypothetical protein